MENPKLLVDVDGEETEIELLLLSSTRRLSDERELQRCMGFERYRDWANGSEGWSAPDAQDALIRASLKRQGVDFTDVDADAQAIVDAIAKAIRDALLNLRMTGWTLLPASSRPDADTRQDLRVETFRRVEVDPPRIGSVLERHGGVEWLEHPRSMSRSSVT